MDEELIANRKMHLYLIKLIFFDEPRKKCEILQSLIGDLNLGNEGDLIFLTNKFYM